MGGNRGIEEVVKWNVDSPYVSPTYVGIRRNTRDGRPAFPLSASHIHRIITVISIDDDDVNINIRN